MLISSFYSKISLLPPHKMEEVMNFIDFLINKEVTQKEIPAQRRKPKFGCAKGTFKMSDDFDAPLEDFNEYMP